MELAKIWESLWRRKWLVIQAVIIMTVTALAGSYLVTPTYKAVSRILVKKPTKGGIDLRDVGLAGLSSSFFASTTNLDVNKLLATSVPYVEEMVYKLQLRNKKGDLMMTEQLTQSGVGSLISNRIFPEPQIGISQYQQTNVLQIEAISPDPVEATMMSNTLAEIVIAQNSKQIKAEYTSAREFLETQIAKVKRRYDTVLEEFTEFRNTEKTIDLKAEMRLAAEKLAELLKEKEDNVIDLAEARSKFRIVQDQLSKVKVESVSVSMLQASPQAQVLKKMLIELELQLAQATAEFTQQHPKVRALTDQLNVTKDGLKQEIEVYRNSAPELSALEKQIAALEVHLEGVNKNLAKYFETLGGMPEKASKQATLDMELNTTQEAYSTLLDSLHEVGMAEATTLSEIQIVESAVEPTAPFWPNKGLYGILGFFIGLSFGTGLALIIEYFDDTIRTSHDVKQFMPIALLGTVPRLAPKMSLIDSTDPNDPIFESYRKVKNCLTMKERPRKTVLVTSAGPSEGRTTSVANLGICAAREGRRVVVVDMDLRRANLHTCFNLSNNTGLTDMINGGKPFSEIVQPTNVKGLHLISSGPPLPDPGALIESDKVRVLISELRKRFDFVILDCAPVLVKGDSLILAQYVDSSIVVLESGKTTRKAVHEVMDTLARSHIKPTGFLLNKCPVLKGKHFYQELYCGHFERDLSAGKSASC